MNLIDHGHHGAVAAGRSSEGFQPLSLGTDGIIDHHQPFYAAVLPIGQNIKIVGQRLRPALLGIADGQRGHITAECQIRVFQPLPRRLRIIGLMQNPKIRARRRKLIRIRLQDTHPYTASHHQKIKQIVVGGKTVDHSERTVIICHWVLVGDRRSSHPQGAAGKELAHMINIVIQLFRFFPGCGRQRTVILHRTAHRFPPEFPAAQPGEESGISTGIDKSAQLFHGIGGMLVRA